jgi:protein TIF31
MNESLKVSSNINEVLDYNINSELLLPFYKVKKPELVQFLSLSGFNPPPTQQKLEGNMFYIHLRVLESVDYHITASPEGFYLNQSKISQFNPAPVPNKPVYASLFDLIKSVS